MIDKIKSAASLLGKKGGTKTKQLYGDDHYHEIGKMAAKSNRERAERLKKYDLFFQSHPELLKECEGEPIKAVD